MFLFVASGLCYCNATPELDALDDSLKGEALGEEWQILKDWRSITLTRKQVQFLNPIGLPAFETEDELFKEFSFTCDYRITITLDDKLTQSEYEELFRLEHKLTAERIAAEKPNAKWTKQNLVHLPSYYTERFSVYIYISDDNFFRTRPASVKTTRDKIMAVLERNFSKYSTEAKPPATEKGK